jgi:hypothetical protein
MTWLMGHYLSVVDDFGPVGKGASCARYVHAENGNEYFIKGPSLTPNHPYVAANELIAVKLAGLLGLPVLDHQILEMGGQLFFGSTYMQHPSFYPQIDETLFNRCENRERVYDLVVFDNWICNVDRHHENLVVRQGKKPKDGEARHLLLLNDHSHCLIQPGGTPVGLKSLLTSGPSNFIRLPFITAAIKDPKKLETSIERVRALQSDQIRTVIESIPEEFLSQGERPVVEEFLLERKSRMLTLFRTGRGSFPNLGEDGL